MFVKEVLRVLSLIVHVRERSAMSGSLLALVKWTEKGKYKDLEQAIQRRFISSKHFGIGDEIEVRWGKAGRVWKAIYLGEQKKEATEQKPKKDEQKRKTDRGEQVAKRKKCEKVSYSSRLH